MHFSRFSVLAWVGLGVYPRIAACTDDGCKCFPDDDCWPSANEWAQLNETVGGRLVATVPLGKPCHGESYDETECSLLKEEWTDASIHYNSSSSVMAPIFANASCDPWQPIDRPCTLGNYVHYAVNATGAADVQATLAFADAYNIRFIIRNTGHDYIGRSTGAGALAIWTHYLKNTSVVQWADDSFTGPALVMGAGVQGFEALDAAHEAGYVVVTGECPTVGVAGGYVQGGGHSMLSTVYGLAADNVLAFDVVLPNGDFVTATSSNEYSDVYWALAGGGPGNYGIVMSATTRLLPDATIGGASLTVTMNSPNTDLLLDVVDTFHAALPAIVQQGITLVYYFSDGYLTVPSLMAYNKTEAETQAILQPLIDALTDLGINTTDATSLTTEYTEYDNYYDHYVYYWGPIPEGHVEVGVSLFGGRLISEENLANFSSISRAMIDLGVTLIGVGVDVSGFGGGSGANSTNAVLPAWRNALVSASMTLPYNLTAPLADMWAIENYNITEVVQPMVDAATPGSGAYMNEGNFRQPDFQEAFYGSNYARLLSIKNTLDPNGLLYAPTAVGSEQWTVDPNGRMCRA